ncbi:MAG: hypothetical protein O3A20_08485 [Planctomycetota bacterium]|nr:hypothetical protein [Planctomycetota bacterium]
MIHSTILALTAALFAAPTSLDAAPVPLATLTLSVTGTCPGTQTLHVTGATPNANVAIIHGIAGRTLRTRQPCAGAMIPLSFPRLGALRTADGSGNVNVVLNTAAGACGRTVVAVDVNSCEVSAPLVV